MKMAFLFLCLLSLPAAFAQSPYAKQESRAIKALSDERISALEMGRGLGYAKAAELNGYPGPLHVLEMADELGLDAEQRRRSRALFEAMRDRARALGRELIAAEAALDRLFAEGGASGQRLSERVSESARIEGELRQVHLQAHIEQAALLSVEQIAAYARRRGYGDRAGHNGAHPGH